MKSQSNKKKVLGIYPSALVIEDTASDYPSEWATTAKFSIGYFTKPTDLDATKIYQTTYYDIIKNSNWQFLSGWKPTITEAWNAAWQSIEQQMIKKLEQ